MFHHECLYLILIIWNGPIVWVHCLPRNITLHIWHDQLLKTFLTDDTMHNSCVNNEMLRCCDCDEYCRFKGSCCIDAFFERYPMRPDHYMDIFMEITKVGRGLRCKPIMEAEATEWIKSIVVRERCQEPSSFPDSDLIERCVNMIPGDEQLWLLKGEDGILYNGSYCAECNNQSNAKPVAIKAEGCELIDESKSVNDPNTLGYQDFQNCYFRINEPNYTDYECRGEVERALRGSLMKSSHCSEYEYKLCLSYNARISFNFFSTFANPHCLKCHHGTNDYDYGDNCQDISFTPPPGYTMTIQMFDNKKKIEVTSSCQAG